VAPISQHIGITAILCTEGWAVWLAANYHLLSDEPSIFPTLAILEEVGEIIVTINHYFQYVAETQVA
jgi:hypothetical protein